MKPAGPKSPENTTLLELLRTLRACRSPRLRTMREFAEAEIVIPDGPYEGRRFRCSRQPYSGLWFDAVDSGRWNRFVATGPTQSGKTLCCFVVPVMFHLFEIGETVICGLPHMDMAADKWREDLLPVISRSRYRELLPRLGGGSRGGKVDAIKFENGATLKFMSGGGGDKSRAGFTSRVLVITETDGMDEPGGASREADKITQLEARTRAYGSRKRIYTECTVSVEAGRTWREYQAGTSSVIMTLCSRCGEFVSPGREHLRGWQEAETALDAAERSAFHCPACGEAWTDAERAEANARAVLVHRGQEIDPSGAVTGDPPRTTTLGFRWSAVHNLFQSAGDVGADEWKAARSADEQNAEKEMLQFVWALPYVPPAVDSTPLEMHALVRRVTGSRRGIVPKGVDSLTMAVDLGKWLCHWVLVAWCDGARGQVVDYGRVEVSSDQFGVERGLLIALRELRDAVLAGWPGEGGDERRVPDQVWIDMGYQAETVYQFCRESAEGSGARFRPSQGLGESQDRARRYSQPKSKGGDVRFVGEGYHLSFLRKEGLHLVEVNADHWKTWV
ncbi:MAG: phage terminase large subunit family protein, partial [Armatimonadetes bacterium]|nr:phage terminase large subunit family protein [Armatimonadota bacterium]